MTDPRVSLLQQTLIPPASPSPHRSLFLSVADIWCQCLPYNRRILFFRSSPQDYSATVEKLKSSLARILVDFYPLAGRLRPGEDGRLEVSCNDLGAEFVEAYVEGVGFNDLESENFDMKPFYNILTRWPTLSPEDLYTAPLLSIQITRFMCGSFALGVAHSHVLADGHSLWHFMTSWAECARGDAISVSPLHTRSLLSVDNPSQKKAVLNIEDVKEESHNLVFQAEKTHKLFHFSKEMVLTLKERASLKGGEALGFSSYEVLCAHLWKCASRAMEHSRETRVGFIIAANMRRRMEPPLPDGYFGNALLWAIVIATVRELEDESLAATALRIRQAVKSCTSVAMEGFLNMLELDGAATFFSRTSLNNVRMRVSSSPKFPMYDTNFGYGKPLAVCSASVEELGKIVLYPSVEGYGSVDVCLALPLHAMHKLNSDPTFMIGLSSSSIS